MRRFDGAPLPRYASEPVRLGRREGTTSWKRTGCGGPCPPIGRHRYFHTLYALDVELPDVKNPTKAALEGAMGGHGVGRAEIIETYEKTRK